MRSSAGDGTSRSRPVAATDVVGVGPDLERAGDQGGGCVERPHVQRCGRRRVEPLTLDVRDDAVRGSPPASHRRAGVADDHLRECVGTDVEVTRHGGCSDREGSEIGETDLAERVLLDQCQVGDEPVDRPVVRGGRDRPVRAAQLVEQCRHRCHTQCVQVGHRRRHHRPPRTGGDRRQQPPPHGRRWCRRGCVGEGGHDVGEPEPVGEVVDEPVGAVGIVHASPTSSWTRSSRASRCSPSRILDFAVPSLAPVAAATCLKVRPSKYANSIAARCRAGRWASASRTRCPASRAIAASSTLGVAAGRARVRALLGRLPPAVPAEVVDAAPAADRHEERTQVATCRIEALGVIPQRDEDLLTDARPLRDAPTSRTATPWTTALNWSYTSAIAESSPATIRSTSDTSHGSATTATGRERRPAGHLSRTDRASIERPVRTAATLRRTTATTGRCDGRPR